MESDASRLERLVTALQAHLAPGTDFQVWIEADAEYGIAYGAGSATLTAAEIDRDFQGAVTAVLKRIDEINRE
jgi:hypothetical protein